MEQIDREKAQRVWKRVQGDRSAPQAPVSPARILQPTPEGLLLEELTDVAFFSQLAHQSRAQSADPLRQLAGQAQNRAGVLQGICRLAELTTPANLPKPGRQDHLPAALRRCMGRLLRRLREYRQLCDHEEFSPLYEALADQTRDSAVLLARIIGK